MKFRILFVLFNAVVLVAFAIIVIMPLVVLGTDYSRAFWQGNWPVAIIFVLVLGGLNSYFGVNWRMFELLEREDWQGLIIHLEKRILGSRRITRQGVRILVNAYVVTGESVKINELENFFRSNAPTMLPRFAPELSVGYLLMNDAEGLERFSAEMEEEPKCTEPVWIRWNHAFALLLQKKVDESTESLQAIAGESMTATQTLLTAYLLDSIAGESGRQDARKIAESFRSRYSKERFQKERQREGGLQVLVLSELINNAVSWAFEGGR